MAKTKMILRRITKATRIADTYGDFLVFQNIRPKYKLINLELAK